ncbi:carbohydrate ABC transporter permease [Corynebacterium guaraldiae]|uniref:Carbohydrate ABC transporter permease n=1 Tax=Corynebacterium guaraldiae TaxID=3051103 RepID=A0ABY3CX53_9CORY|nr:MULTISPECIES: carbohydrate ABC transporter permease [Corynebacterium]MDK6806178.1 carbohydrate ABC transporter permease [Corynebacterium aurimucosum]NJJ82293.1 carbohydrate ABC transporter permease [Corynebacterium aurimucosum]TRX33408.1 carbohydrate ABC transporter permease [Corynebacterium guaraldiae]TRX51160.1 carbohydrate ABC transporter permease [Corynebacterium guaraldiae]
MMSRTSDTPNKRVNRVRRQKRSQTTQTTPNPSSQLRSPLMTALIWVWLLIACIFIIFPVVYAFVGSVRSTADIQAGIQTLFFGDFVGSNYPRAWEQSQVGQQLVNSLIVTVCQTGGQFITSVLAAFALAFGRIPMPGKILGFFLIPMMIPSEVSVIGNYLTVSEMGLYDTVIAIFLPYVASSFTIFLFYQAFKQFPKEIYEATKLEGVSRIRFLFTFLLPLNRSVCMTALVTGAIAAWNGYMWPLLITQSPSVRTIQPGIKALADETAVDTGLVLAGLLIAALPTIILVIFGQKYLSRGLTEGAVK